MAAAADATFCSYIATNFVSISAIFAAAAAVTAASAAMEILRRSRQERMSHTIDVRSWICLRRFRVLGPLIIVLYRIYPINIVVSFLSFNLP